MMTRRSLPAVLLTATSAPARGAFAAPASFGGGQPGAARAVDAIDLRWCPAGRFTMGSPPAEPERRPGEDQVEVTLSHGFWMAKYDHIGFRVVAVQR
jgi:formylglycine-generating enzyme required for sulfatase activity